MLWVLANALRGGLTESLGTERYFLELFYVVCCQGRCAVPFLATHAVSLNLSLLHTIGTSLWEDLSNLRTAFGYDRPDTTISKEGRAQPAMHVCSVYGCRGTVTPGLIYRACFAFPLCSP